MSGNTIATRTIIACTGVLIFLGLLRAPAWAVGSMTSADCLMCHSAKTLAKTAGLKKSSLYVSAEKFATSAHGMKECVFCHADMKHQPLKHKTPVAPVDCIRCHEKKGWNPNTIHYAISDSLTPPKCQDCHGSHYMKPKTDATSATNPTNADAICAKCHSKSKTLRPYERGIHSDMGENSRPAAGCVDCHSPHSGQPASAPVICAKCHSGQYREYSHSAHGKALAQGNTDVPTCVKCHGAHDILPKDDTRSPIYPTNVPAKCGQCHDNAKMMGAYNLTDDRLKTYRESYHGIANKYGDLDVATCADCHEAHDVLPSRDAASTCSKQNVPRTCGKCHHGMSAKVAQGQAHVVITHHKRDALFWVSFAFKWLTIGTMMALVGHIMLDLQARIRGRRRRTRR